MLDGEEFSIFKLFEIFRGAKRKQGRTSGLSSVGQASALPPPEAEPPHSNLATPGIGSTHDPEGWLADFVSPLHVTTSACQAALVRNPALDIVQFARKPFKISIDKCDPAAMFAALEVPRSILKPNECLKCKTGSLRVKTGIGIFPRPPSALA